MSGKKKKMIMYFLCIHKEIILFVRPFKRYTTSAFPCFGREGDNNRGSPRESPAVGGDAPRPPGLHHGSAKPELLLPLGSTG